MLTKTISVRNYWCLLLLVIFVKLLDLKNHLHECPTTKMTLCLFSLPNSTWYTQFNVVDSAMHILKTTRWSKFHSFLLFFYYEFKLFCSVAWIFSLVPWYTFSSSLSRKKTTTKNRKLIKSDGIFFANF